jgi:hypothetical protein
MAQATIFVSDRTNRILNIIKAQQGLKDKSAVIDFVVERYAEVFLPTELQVKGEEPYPEEKGSA